MPLPFLPQGIAGVFDNQVAPEPKAIVFEMPKIKQASMRIEGRTPDSALKLGETLAYERGWSSNDFNCVKNLWTKESNWRWKAANKKSSAYGIPQILGLSKDLTPKQQIIRGYDYIVHRYKSPCTAWSFWQRNYYY